MDEILLLMLLLNMNSENESKNDIDEDEKIREVFRSFGFDADFCDEHLPSIKKVVKDSNGFISYGELAMVLTSDDEHLQTIAAMTLVCAKHDLEANHK